ncbi:signal peptidase I [Tunturiibacter empetritectus]|uniref:Signal peptidase I n=1 Tax=Tunturiibacter lichenicola TaxID=2051959 RepID=A0A852V5K8_9BACT|nr:signal peptidase I [Edaphobacter lichenicola]NYF88308.1 signal peptidase I [Edaphobacter lichenicola]
MTQPAVASSRPGTHSSSDTSGTPQARPPLPSHPLTHRHHLAHHDRPSVFTALQSLLHLIVIAIFIITFCVQPFRIPSESMESTLLVGDFLLVDKQAVAPDGAGTLLPTAAIHRGDVIVFHDPVDATLHLVKRVIGLPGDHLRLRDGRVYINGHALTEPYAVYRPSPPDNFRDNFPRLQSADPEIDSHWWIRMRSLIENNELIIPIGNYFVLGDNRNDSEDSRYWGFVPREAIVGKPLLIYFSLQPHEADDTDGYGGNDASIAQSATATTRRHPGKIDSVVDFARWGRTFQVVR